MTLHWYHYALWSLKIAIDFFIFLKTIRYPKISILFACSMMFSISLLQLQIIHADDAYRSAFIVSNIVWMLLFSWVCCEVSKIKHGAYILGALALAVLMANPPTSTLAIMDETRFVMFCAIAVLLVGLYKETAGRLGWGLLSLAGSQVVCAFLQPGMMHHMDAMRCIWMVSWMAGCSVIGWAVGRPSVQN